MSVSGLSQPVQPIEEVQLFDRLIPATNFPEVETGKTYTTDLITGISETEKRMDISLIPSNSIISRAKYCMKNTDTYVQSTWQVSRIPDQDWNPISGEGHSGYEESYSVHTTNNNGWTCIDVKNILQVEVYLDHSWLSFKMSAGVINNPGVLNFWDPYMKVGSQSFWYHIPGAYGEDYPYLEVRVFR